MINENFTIGIITYHDVYSYGANLQCLGLQMFLQEKGYRVEIIDYSTNGYLELREKKKIPTFFYRSIHFLCNPIGFLKVKLNSLQIERKSVEYKEILEQRNKKFKEFQNKFYHLSVKRYKKYSELQNNPPLYSAYICGSDQIWNPGFCDMDDNYFLAFAEKGKRVAYAPSFGVASIPFYAKRIYKKRLKGIDILSIREKTGRTIIRNLIGKDVPLVLDPTFLIEKEKWIELVARESTLEVPEEYIFTYFIGNDEYTQKFLKHINESFPEYEIINLVFDQSSYGPCDFIKLINQAKFVFTNSFHGIAFCINLNIPFAVGKTLKDFGAGSAFSRIYDLLENLKLTNRIYDDNKKLDGSWLKLNFDTCNEIKEKMVERSKGYLLDALEIIDDKKQDYGSVK